MLTNLRFADDVLIIGKSLHQVTNMLGQIATKAAKSGLQLHPDKTKIMSNTTRRTSREREQTVQVERMNIEILPIEGSMKYLGRQICFDQPHEVEIQNRKNAAWKKFHVLKEKLTNKKYSLSSRLKVFNGTVTPTMLYGCCTWTLTTKAIGGSR